MKLVGKSVSRNRIFTHKALKTLKVKKKKKKTLKVFNNNDKKLPKVHKG